MLELRNQNRNFSFAKFIYLKINHSTLMSKPSKSCGHKFIFSAFERNQIPNKQRMNNIDTFFPKLWSEKWFKDWNIDFSWETRLKTEGKKVNEGKLRWKVGKSEMEKEKVMLETVWMCDKVCVWKGEKKKERSKKSEWEWMCEREKVNVRVRDRVCACVCVWMCDKERERGREAEVGRERVCVLRNS